MNSQPSTTRNYDAILLLSFGGPESRDDVIPFLENVLRGRNVPRERLLEVAEHYYHFDGISPINQQCRALIKDLQIELTRREIELPIYWGNRNWHPFLAETLREMHENGIRRILTLVTSAFSSYSGCRQYREDLDRARLETGLTDLQTDKIRVFYNHPRFINTLTDRVREAWEKLPAGTRAETQLICTAHSIPNSMADRCDYVHQLSESTRLVRETLGIPESQTTLVYQSRSGRPQDPWLEPDILAHLRALHARGVRQIVLLPIGFLSDHMEVLYDLDYEAANLAAELGMTFVRAGTPAGHPEFAPCMVDLIEEYLGRCPPVAVGFDPPRIPQCREDCCPGPAQRPVRPGA